MTLSPEKHGCYLLYEIIQDANCHLLSLDQLETDRALISVIFISTKMGRQRFISNIDQKEPRQLFLKFPIETNSGVFKRYNCFRKA